MQNIKAELKVKKGAKPSKSNSLHSQGSVGARTKEVGEAGYSVHGDS